MIAYLDCKINIIAGKRCPRIHNFLKGSVTRNLKLDTNGDTLVGKEGCAGWVGCDCAGKRHCTSPEKNRIGEWVS